MNIETKAHKLRSTGIAGQVEIRNKSAGRSSYVRALRALAIMHHAMGRSLGENQSPN